MKYTTEYNCPVCAHALAVEDLNRQKFLWCAYGPCANIAANQGGRGPTEAEAFKALCERVNKEENER